VTATANHDVLDRAHQVVGASTLDDGALRRWLHGLPGVDEVGADGRAAMLSTRSIKAGTKARALDLAVRMIDLTTLEGADTPGTVRSLCAKARRPDPVDPTCPPVAAVCVYNDLVGVAAQALEGNGVRIAAVTTAFPSGRASLPVKLADTFVFNDTAANEIDTVIDRGAFLSGRYGQVFEEILAVREVCHDVPPGFLVLSGDDALTLPAMAVGAQGVISVASNEVPGLMARMVEAFERADVAAARDLHQRLLPLILANFAESNPIPVKAALAMMGLLEETYRLPLVPPRAETRARLASVLSDLALMAKEN
jgi:hypothetical protein